jgi:hypothetical protein
LHAKDIHAVSSPNLKRRRRRSECFACVLSTDVAWDSKTGQTRRRRRKTFTHANYRKTRLDKREKVRPDVPLLNPYWKLLIFFSSRKKDKRKRENMYIHTYKYSISIDWNIIRDISVTTIGDAAAA